MRVTRVSFCSMPRQNINSRVVVKLKPIQKRAMGSAERGF
jgi:hypothetical protein